MCQKGSDDVQFVKVTELRNALGDIKRLVRTKHVAVNGRLCIRFKQKLVCYHIVR